MKLKKLISVVAVSGALLASANANAGTGCEKLRLMAGAWAGYTEAVETAYDETLGLGFGLGMWATLMDTYGNVCFVYSVDGATGANNGGPSAGNTAWLGSRVISMQKASTANYFSLDELSIPTGAVSAAVQPGGSLYGLQHSNPVDATAVYAGWAGAYGTFGDPMKGKRSGGVNVFGGGIALYDRDGVKVGAVGVSGDTSCRDASMAYVLRRELGLDNAPNDDTLYLDDGLSTLFEQPTCGVADPVASDNVGVQVGSAD